MRPVPVPDARIWEGQPGHPVERITLGAPPGFEAVVHPIEVLVEPNGGPANPLPGGQVHVLCALEPGDLERLASDPHLWLTFWGSVVPFALSLPDPADG